MATKMTKDMASSYEEVVSADDFGSTQTSTFKFQDNETMFFEPTKGGMQVVMKHQLLPRFEGDFFKPDFLEFLREHKVGGVAIDQLYDAVEESLRKSLVIQELMKCMK